MSVQFIRLWPRRPPDGSLPLGLSCDDEGLLLAGNCRLIEACLDRDGHLFYRARPASELSTILTAAYGEAIDATPICPAIEQIAKLMTERNWSRARLAALHLRLPELADRAAAARVLRADALLKVTASFDPDKHPRWPKGSQEGHGGEFRPVDDGDLLVPVADPISDPDPSKLQEHVHHWFPQSLREALQKRGLLSPEADNLLRASPLATEKVVQDPTDKSNTWRIHQYDTPHRDYNEAVKGLVEKYIEENQITKKNPMAEFGAAEVLVQIKESTVPDIANYRQSVKRYNETEGDIAAQRFRQYRLLPPRASGGAKANMPRDRERSLHQRAENVKLVEDRIYENLLPLGLEPNRDYSFYDRVPYGHTFIGFERRELLTPDLIVACTKALASKRWWSIRIGLIDEKTRKFEAVISTDGDRLSQASDEEWAIILGLKAWQRMEATNPSGMPSEAIENLIREMPAILRRVRKK